MHRSGAFVILAAFIVAITAALPAVPQEDGAEPKALAMAIDLMAATSTSAMQCYQRAGYQTAFIRIYTSTGTPDPNGPANLQNANTAGLGLEVFIEPQTSVNAKPGYQQFDEAYNYVTSHGVNIRSVWLKVTLPINWSNNPSSNVGFIQSMQQRAQQRGLGFGIYTNSYDWSQITNNYFLQGTVNLWYWNTNGNGQAGSTPPNFTDFANFGSWTRPLVKQYAKSIYVCSAYVNLDVYQTNRKVAAKAEKVDKVEDGKKQLVAGLLME